MRDICWLCHILSHQPWLKKKPCKIILCGLPSLKLYVECLGLDFT